MATFVLYESGIKATLANESLIKDMRRRAERAKRYAEAIAPVDSGHYQASFRVRYGVKNGKAWARLENTASYAVFLEYGTRYMKAQRIIGRSMDIMML